MTAMMASAVVESAATAAIRVANSSKAHPAVPARPWANLHHGPHGELDFNACPRPQQGAFECMARIRADAAAARSKPAGIRGAVPSSTLGDNGAYSPAYLQSAYNAPSGSEGYGETVAIVDAYDDPSAAIDLTQYRSHYDLPPCTTANGCFRKVDESGGTDYPPPDGDWAVEISLDLDMVSALCPNCHILLVEATSDDSDDLGAAEDEAVALGANVISNSYGSYGEEPSETSYDHYYDHPGVAITVASGDDGYGVSYPAASPYVTAVGGTTLYQATDTGTREGSEVAWDGSGSGCSAYEPKPLWQHDTGCPNRTVADVSAVADPDTPVWAYDSYPYPTGIKDGKITYTVLGWVQVGGTSVAAPLVAGIYALAGGASSSADTPAGYPYSQSGQLNNITYGSNGTCSPTYLCTAGPGYNGPTGLGTPNGVRAFQASPPSSPTQLNVRGSDGSVALSWSPPASDGGSPIESYNVYRSDVGSSPLATLSASTTTYTDATVSNGDSYTYTVTATNAAGEGPPASGSITPDPIDYLNISPSISSVVTGESQSYDVTAFESSGQSLGDETAFSSFSISPDGSCAVNVCSAVTPGLHTVTATLGSVEIAATLDVNPIESLSISPPLATIALDGGLGLTNDSQSFTVEGTDSSDDSLDLTDHVSFSISPDGTCTEATCTANDLGVHTVTASYGSLSTSAVLIVVSGPFAPTVTRIHPSYGSPSGGTSVTVFGDEFTPDEDGFSTTVDFGSTPSTSVSVISGTKLTTIAPPGTGTVDVTVTTYYDGASFGTSSTVAADQFAYDPTVKSLSTHYGSPRGGTTVVVLGTNFSDVTAVDFGSSAAESYTPISSTRIRAVAPAGTGTVDVTVTSTGGVSSTGADDLFTYR